jgi:AbrB family looped-hinge helix DNA binding protein
MQSGVLTTKGQIVIPKELRDKYKLSPGTRVLFEETAEGIILKQADAGFIKNARGMIPTKKGDKPMSEWWPKYKAEERALEAQKLNLLSEPYSTYKRAVKIKRKK